MMYDESQAGRGVVPDGRKGGYQWFHDKAFGGQTINIDY